MSSLGTSFCGTTDHRVIRCLTMSYQIPIGSDASDADSVFNILPSLWCSRQMDLDGST